MEEYKLATISEFMLDMDDETMQLRVEVFQSASNAQAFKLRIYRLEYFRIQSTFPQNNGKPLHTRSDHKVWVGSDEMLTYPEEVSANSVEEALDFGRKVIKKFYQRVYLNQKIKTTLIYT